MRSPADKSNKTLKLILAFLCVTTMTYAPSSMAAVVDLATMLENFSKTVPQFMRLVTAFAYVSGMYLVFKGVMGLKQYGEQRTQMSSSHELKGPLLTMAVGTALLYLPSTVEAGLSTFWMDPNPYGYVQTDSDQWNTLIQDCFAVIQLIGVIAFIRGLFVLGQLSGQAQPGTFGKGLAHIIGGVLAINLYQFAQAVINTLALGQI